MKTQGSDPCPLTPDSSQLVGAWFEPIAAFRCLPEVLPHSDSLVRVREVLHVDGPNTFLQCETHHGECFVYRLSWLRDFWKICDCRLPIAE
jgi:hypothetical protein